MRWLATIFTIQVIASLLVDAAVMNITNTQGVEDNRYNKAHHLPESHSFNPRDGWQSITISNLNYKYHASGHKNHSFHEVLRRSSPSETPTSVNASKSKEIQNPGNASNASTGVIGSVVRSLASIFSGLVGKGSPQGVTITWYTGHDLENPSCWNNGGWSPTDNSFVGAVTMEGWMAKPECFKFIELCNGKEKCIFVRIVDTCAGCAKGSPHVDLTKAAFSNLADLDEGVLTVQMRDATEPDKWSLDLWGPKTTES